MSHFMLKKVKRHKRILIIKIIIFIILICSILTVPIIMSENFNKTQQENQNASMSGIATITSTSNLPYTIDDEIYEVNVEIKANNDEYSIVYGIGEERKEEKFSKAKKIEFKCNNEGKNSCYIAIKKDNEILQEWNKDVYRINSYKKQFLDELSKKGICVHYQNGNWENYGKSSKALKALGIQYVRSNFIQRVVQKEDGSYDFSKYDEWINDLTSTSNIKPILLFAGLYPGNDGNYRIDSEEEIEQFCQLVKNTRNHYPNLQYIEVLNEVNYNSNNKGGYLVEKDTTWYSKVLNKLSLEYGYKDVMTGGTAPTPINQKTIITPTNFLKNIYNTGGLKGVSSFAHHPYYRKSVNFYETVKEQNEFSNEIGGFNRLNITEYGYSSAFCKDDEEQGINIMKMTLGLEETSNLIIMHNLWSITAKEDSNSKLGLLDFNYVPKQSYYIMKNYYENTNGAEYIGKINMNNTIDCYVFDKDGEVLLIMWAKDENTTSEACWSDNKSEIKLDNVDFEIHDIYGKNISNENFTVTSVPTYGKSSNRKYFYQAISSMLLEKYNEFEEKYKVQISKISGVQGKLNEMKQMAQNIGTHSENSEIDENTAIKLMEEFYGLGDTLISAYEKGELNVDEQKLSSMLDDLNDIGNSYEDLVTITAKTRNIANLQETNSLMETADKIANSVKNLDNVYPSKILSFSQDFYDEANYINGLQEENKIKTGLIVSKNLHSKLLANWAKNFAYSYMSKKFKVQGEYVLFDNYIKNISVGTKVKDLKGKINSSFEYEIKRGSNVLGDNNTLATGDILQLKNTDMQYEIVVAGDINKDGSVNVTDLVKVRKTILGLTQLSDIEKFAADANLDNQNISISDLVKIRKIILGI